MSKPRTKTREEILARKREYNREYRKRRGSRAVIMREYETALAVSKPVKLATIMTAAVKPRNTSDVRWRIELARRANPWRFAVGGC